MKVFHPDEKNYIGIDYETIGLPNGANFRQIKGRVNILNPMEKSHPFSDNVTTQFATWDASIDKITHFHIDYDSNKRHSRFIQGSSHKRSVKDPTTGLNTTLDAYRIRRVDTKDILEMVGASTKAKGKKGEAISRGAIAKALGQSEVMLVYNGDHISEFAFNDLIKVGGKKGSLLKKKIDIDFPAMDFKNISQREFAGKGSGSLYNQVDNWLKKATKEKPLILGAWNPFFDMNQMIADLKRFGYAEKAMELYNAYKVGVIEIDAVEKYWQAIVFRLSKEDPAFAAHFRIGTHLDAALSTGRPGQIAKTFEEFEHSNLWNAEHVGGILKKYFNIDTNQLHAAGPDVHNEMKTIKKVLFEIAEASGVSFDKLVETDASGSLLHTLKNSSFTKKLEAKYGKKVIDEMKNGISSSQNALRVNRELPTLFKSIGMAKKTKSMLSKWGGIGAAIGLATYVTYGKGEDSLFPFSNKTKFGTMSKPKAIRYKTQFEDSPSYTAQIAEAVGFGLLGPAALMYGVGAYASMTEPQKLGFRPELPKAPGGASKHVLDTIYKGIIRTEQKVAISRVFGLSNSIDFLKGTFQHSGINPITKETRGFSFYTIKKGVAQTVTGTGRNVHGVKTESFLREAKSFLTEEKYNILHEKLNPNPHKIGNTSSRQVILKTVNKKTVIAISDLDEDGVLTAKKYMEEIPVTFHYNKMRGEGQLNRLEWGLQQTDEILEGTSPRSTFEEFYKKIKMPEFLKNKPQWAGAYKLTQKIKFGLDILPKGIGQGSNKIFPNMPHKLAGIERGIHATGYTGNWFKTMVARTKYGIRVPNNILIDKMNQFFESPFELLGVPTNKIDEVAAKLAGSTNIIKGFAGKALSTIARPHLGLPSYSYKYGFPEYMAKIGMKRILPAAIAITAFQGLDHLLGMATLSPTGRGPLTMAPIKAYEAATLLYSKISDITGFTSLTKKQERVAPGSTGIGMIAPAMSAVSLFKVSEMIYKGGPSAIRDSINNLGTKLLKNDFIRNSARPERFAGTLGRGTLETMMAYAIKNPKKGLFALMMAPMLPFFPGLIGSNKTYEERKAEYSGKKEVAIRKYRGWLLSPSPYAGGKPIQYRRHFLNLVESNYGDRGVIWPSFGSHMAHTLTLGLANRYALEEYHKDSQPVYESAAYGANIPFVGPAIAATIGRIIKPTVTYHKLEEASQNIGMTPYIANMPTMGNMFTQATAPSEGNRVAATVGMKSEGSTGALYNRWAKQFHDLIGFTGFSYETAQNALTGKRSPDEFTPYAQSGVEMYNPAQQMWGWHLGDITGVGGEFLRRIFPFPQKNWKVNDIPNELAGTSWIPQGETDDKPGPFKKLKQDLTHGTTFDKVPLGWLHASRKGWEFLYPEVKGKELEQYPDPIRLEVLQHVAPYSREFSQTAQNVLKSSLSNRLNPDAEQRYYETLNQVRQLKDQLYANESEFTASLRTKEINGTIENIDEEGGFYLQGDNKKYRLSGVSLADADIRARLLQNKKFDSAQELEESMQDIKEKTISLFRQRMASGTNISMQVAGDDQISGSSDGVEAIVGGLNGDLNDLGAPFKNTGNLAEHNLQQKKVGPMSTFMAKYWNNMTNDDTFWSRKLIPNRDYMHSYLQTQVFNREVKLWSKPIDHFIKPMVASVLHRGILGLHIDKIPSFTIDRRKKQEYWDILKYVKYKTLAVRAAKDGNDEDATYYHNMWRSTMIGANAVDDNTRNIIAALPQTERPYFNKFINEADPKKRAKIYKFLPRATKRIYSAIWTKKLAEQSGDPEQLENLRNLEETDGWGMSEEEEKQYQQEAPGASKGDWIRAKYVNEYLKKNPMPDQDWSGWSPDVNEESVELLSLREQGEQIEDFGFFENKARVAAYDQGAYQAAITINSVSGNAQSTIGNILSTIIQDDRVSSIQSMPSMTTNPIVEINMNTHMNDRVNQNLFTRYADILNDSFGMI